MIKHFAMPLFLVVMMTGCSSTSEIANTERGGSPLTSLPCHFPDTPDAPAPIWVCEGRVQGIAMQAAGMSEVAHGGLSHQRQLAIMDGQSILAQQLNAKIEGAISNYVVTQGRQLEDHALNETSEYRSGKLNNEIIGMKIYQSLRSPNGVYYVLVGLGEAELKENVNKKLGAVHPGAAEQVMEQLKAEGVGAGSDKVVVGHIAKPEFVTQ